MTFQTRLGVIFLVSACPFLLLADGVSISSSCSLTNTDFSVSPPVKTVASQVNPTGDCAVTLADPFGTIGNAHASASATLYLPVPGSPSTPVGGEIAASIGVRPGTQFGGAQFSISLDLLFSTPGPVRSGFIAMNYHEGFGIGPDAPDIGTANVSIGSFTPSRTFPGHYNSGTSPLFPFTLASP